jgi:hypothetical protein
MTSADGQAELPRNNQHRVAFVFLAFAVFIVYGTLLVVYMCRYRFFTPAPDRRTHFSSNERLKSIPDQYVAINRWLHRLKADTDKEKNER